MKKIITLSICVLFVTMAMSQGKGVAVFESKKDMDAKKGSYQFQCEVGTFNEDDILMQMAEYAGNFQLDYETKDDLHYFTIQMDDVSEENNKALLTFMKSINLQKAHYKGKYFSIDAFFEKYVL